MAESFPPAHPEHAGTTSLSERRVPLWLAILLTLGAAFAAAWATQAWLMREPGSAQAVQGMLTDEHALIDLAPPAAGKTQMQTPMHTPMQTPMQTLAPAMLYGMLPLHSGHGLREEQCRQLAVDAMQEAGITDIDAGGESTLFARQGDYALFVGCHLDQKLILVGAAGPVPEQAESLQAQLLRSLQTRF